jgi:glucose/arabinose dehydrogenase
MRYGISIIAASLMTAWTISPVAVAQKDGSNEQTKTAGPASNPDQELGRRFLIRQHPRAVQSLQAGRSSYRIQGQTPRVIAGFTVMPFIVGLEHPRRLLVLPNNDVIVAEQRTGHLTLLRDEDGDGRADYVECYADDFKAPYGLAYRDGYVLVADQEGIWRVPHVSGAVRGGPPRSTEDCGCAAGKAQTGASGLWSGVDHQKGLGPG